jgi:hypothetical protein
MRLRPGARPSWIVPRRFSSPAMTLPRTNSRLFKKSIPRCSDQRRDRREEDQRDGNWNACRDPEAHRFRSVCLLDKRTNEARPIIRTADCSRPSSSWPPCAQHHQPGLWRLSWQRSTRQHRSAIRLWRPRVEGVLEGLKTAAPCVAESQ